MSTFSFVGEIPSSKSALIRGLILQSYYPDLQISGDSSCDDVLRMKAAVKDFGKAKEFDCGDAGAVFRFMALRASREVGTWRLKGSHRLLQRPHEALIFILDQLGVHGELGVDALTITSQGWKKTLVPLHVHRDKSSQFASGVLLNAWNLPFGISFEMKGLGLSEGYWQMSLQACRDLGMRVDQKGRDQIFVPPGQIATNKHFRAEVDYSSVFVICAAAALAGRAEISNCDQKTLQPDYAFIEIFLRLGIPVIHEKTVLRTQSPKKFKAIEVDIRNSPDLFPVLAVLCAFANGRSKIFGAPQLAFKESNRIEKTAELLAGVGATVEKLPDGLVISGISERNQAKPFTFDPDQDHRMAMAAGLLKLRGFPITIRNPEVVKKSFPDFWKIIGINP